MLNTFENLGIIITLDTGDQIRVEGLKNLSGTHADEIRQQIKNKKSKIVRALRHQEFDSLWGKAQALADWIDNSESDVPRQERAAKVPELQEMSIEIDRLEALTKAGEKNNNSLKPVTENRLNYLESFSPLLKLLEPKKYHQDSCPARCNQSGKCYGKAYFNGKPGKALLCTPDKCLWNDQLKQNLERNKE